MWQRRKLSSALFYTWFNHLLKKASRCCVLQPTIYNQSCTHQSNTCKWLDRSWNAFFFKTKSSMSWHLTSCYNVCLFMYTASVMFWLLLQYCNICECNIWKWWLPLSRPFKLVPQTCHQWGSYRVRGISLFLPRLHSLSMLIPFKRLWTPAIHAANKTTWREYTETPRLFLILY